MTCTLVHQLPVLTLHTQTEKTQLKHTTTMAPQQQCTVTHIPGFKKAEYSSSWESI